jgi:hypothetical protein
MYHQNRASDEQLRGPLAYKRRIENIYEDMIDEWLPQGPHINSCKQYYAKRIRGLHKRTSKRSRKQSRNAKKLQRIKL